MKSMHIAVEGTNPDQSLEHTNTISLSLGPFTIIYVLVRIKVLSATMSQVIFPHALVLAAIVVVEDPLFIRSQIA